MLPYGYSEACLRVDGLMLVEGHHVWGVKMLCTGFPDGPHTLREVLTNFAAEPTSMSWSG